MAKSSDEDILLDPRFYVPPFVIDVRQEGERDGGMDYRPGDIADPGPTITTPGNGGGTNIPMPPTTISVVSETVRITSDGRTVVDLVLEFPDVQGIEQIDVGMTKE